MFVEGAIRFGRYRFHPMHGLTRGRQAVRVTPKSLAVLGILLERSGQVVTREELFRAVWPDTAVSEAALTTCIQELRRILVDDAREPKYIETVHRRGFRFVAQSSAGDSLSIDRVSQPVPPKSLGPIVGRDAELRMVLDALASARAGRRSVVFVSGEPGIGKTALVDFLLAAVYPTPVRLARATCVEHYGANEAYQPLLEGLTRLCTQPDGESCLAVLRQCAPTWLAQLPSVQTQAERQSLQRRTAGATPERMLRELTDALEALSQQAAIVLCLEDLHWSDPSTLDWIRSFAVRPEPASVLIVATYRPGEGVSPTRSPEALASDLMVKGFCTEIALARLQASDVGAYVVARFPPADGAGASLQRLAGLVHQRTEGNPLFVVNALADLTARNVLVGGPGGWAPRERCDAASLAIPGDIWRTIDRQIDRLSDGERLLLEAASMISGSCAAATVAAGAGVSQSDAEATLAALARRNAFVAESTPIEWPDGTLSASFEFMHSLYREVLSARVSPARRADLHRSIGQRLEDAFGGRVTEIASELAVHFEHGRDPERAVRYLQHAAETDRSRSAHDLAERHYRKALAFLERLPPGDGRDDREAALRIGLGGVLMQTCGWGAPEVEAVYARVRELSEARGPAGPLLSALWNLWIFSMTRGDLGEARSFADNLLQLANRTGDPTARLQACHARWSTLFTVGDLRGAEAHAREGLTHCGGLTGTTLDYGSHDTGVCARMFCARALACAGQTETAAAFCDEALAMARAIGHPFSLAFALMHAAAVHETRRDMLALRAHAVEGTHLAREHGFALMLAWSTCSLGWSLVHLGEIRDGLRTLTEGVAGARNAGSILFQAHMLGLLASAQAANGHITEALQTIAEALAMSDRTGERFFRAELHRLKGEFWLAHDGHAGVRGLAEAEFQTALGVARDQHAWQLALRAAVSLSRLWIEDGRSPEAVALVAESRDAVAEGPALPDVLEAEALIGGRSRKVSSRG